MSEATFIIIFKVIVGILVGGTLGSFAGVVLYRLPRKQSIIAPRSYCNTCKKPLEPRDLVPILSYYINNKKCRYCGAPIGFTHVLLELLFMAICIGFMFV